MYDVLYKTPHQKMLLALWKAIPIEQKEKLRKYIYTHKESNWED